MIDSVKACYVANASRTSVACNSESGIGRGYEFFHNNPGTDWHGNSMTMNEKGFVMNYGLIGTQGSMASSLNNQWQVSSSASMGGTAWWAYTGTYPYQTHVIGSPNALSSKLYINGGTITYPSNNGSSIPSNDYTFLSLGAIKALNLTAAPYPSCISFAAATAMAGMDAFENIATNNVAYESATDQRGWMGQYTAWQSVICDSDLVDSSAVMGSFCNLAQGSRYAYLTGLENMLALGDMNGAAQVMATPPSAPQNNAYDNNTGAQITDNQGADNIVDRYLAFYSIYMNYTNGSMTAQDNAELKAIAMECPLKYGSVVYRARSLYTAVFDQLVAWNDDYCSDQLNGGNNGQRKGNTNGTDGSTAGQQYLLSPNPTDGNITLTQLVPDTKPVVAEIWNALGQSVYQSSLDFITGSAQINLNGMASGLYMIRLTDAKNTSYKIKFVVR